MKFCTHLLHEQRLIFFEQLGGNRETQPEESKQEPSSEAEALRRSQDEVRQKYSEAKALYSSLEKRPDQGPAAQAIWKKFEGQKQKLSAALQAGTYDIEGFTQLLSRRVEDTLEQLQALNKGVKESVEANRLARSLWENPDMKTAVHEIWQNFEKRKQELSAELQAGTRNIEEFTYSLSIATDGTLEQLQLMQETVSDNFEANTLARLLWKNPEQGTAAQKIWQQYVKRKEELSADSKAGTLDGAAISVMLSLEAKGTLAKLQVLDGVVKGTIDIKNDGREKTQTDTDATLYPAVADIFASAQRYFREYVKSPEDGKEATAIRNNMVAEVMRIRREIQSKQMEPDHMFHYLMTAAKGGNRRIQEFHANKVKEPIRDLMQKESFNNEQEVAAALQAYEKAFQITFSKENDDEGELSIFKGLTNEELGRLATQGQAMKTALPSNSKLSAQVENFTSQMGNRIVFRQRAEQMWNNAMEKK